MPGHGGPVAGGALVGDLAAGAAEVGDPLVPPGDQVVDDQPGPGGVVAADHVGPDQALPARAGDDHRDVADGGGQAAVVGQRPDHHQPLDLEGAQRLHRPQVQARPSPARGPGMTALVRRVSRPASCSTVRSGSTISTNQGLCRSATSTPTVPERRVDSDLAAQLVR